MSQTNPLLLKMVDWPEADRLAWNALFASGDILNDRGTCFDWAEGSRRKREQSYSRWLGFLRNVGAFAPQDGPTDRARPARIAAFIASEQHRCKMRTVHIRVEDLWFLFRAMDPERDWQWLYEIVLRLRAVANIGFLKPHPGVDAVKIFDWARTRLASVDAEVGPIDRDRAVRYRDGLIVGLLISTPVRSRTFLAIAIGDHLKDLGAGFQLRFKPADIKDRKHHDFPVHPQLTTPLRRYLETFRPVLLQGQCTNRLWVSQRGAPLCHDSLYGHLCDLTLREFGERLGPHAFRHVAATTVAMADPKHVGIIADVLGHSSLNMAYKHYNHAGTIRAVSRYQDLQRQLRLEARRRAREASKRT